MIIEPLAGALGAEVRGVVLADLQDETAWQAIRRAFLRYSVLAFRDQALEPADLMRVGGRFGEPCFYPFVTGLDGYPHIFEVVKEEQETTNFGGNWHSDTTYLAQPPLATLLQALETPAYGGDTLFTPTSPPTRFFMPSDSASYAAWVLAKSVSPPYAGVSSAWSSVASGGCAR